VSSECPPYKIVTGVTLAKDSHVRTAVVVIADVVDDRGLVTDKGGFEILMQHLKKKEFGKRHMPKTLVIVRGM
jgi:hypothetical protein